MKKKLIYIGIFASLLVSCTESLEDKAAREAKEYTEKYCPTPYVNDARTDSATFDKTKKIYTYYISLRNKADNKKAIDANKGKLHKIQKHLEAEGFEVTGAEFTYIPNDLKDVTPEERETIDKMVEKLEEFDDVQTVYTNMKPEIPADAE